MEFNKESDWELLSGVETTWKNKSHYSREFVDNKQIKDLLLAKCFKTQNEKESHFPIVLRDDKAQKNTEDSRNLQYLRERYEKRFSEETEVSVPKKAWAPERNKNTLNTHLVQDKEKEQQFLKKFLKAREPKGRKQVTEHSFQFNELQFRKI